MLRDEVVRQSPWFSALLDGVKVISLARVVGVAFGLTRVSLIDPLPVVSAALALIV